MKSGKRRKIKKPKKAKGRQVKIFAAFITVSVISFAVIKYYDSKVMPSVKKAMEQYGVTAATKIIDSSVKSVIDNSGVSSEDLFNKTMNMDGKLTSLSADTVLINSICADVSEGVLKGLQGLENNDIFLPVGILSGFEFLSAKGPNVFKIEFRPAGECSVDYDTSFKSEGINQINYQIWLNVKTNIIIINPLTNHSITVTRKVPIVNAYINGDVPEAMTYPYIGIPSR